VPLHVDVLDGSLQKFFLSRIPIRWISIRHSNNLPRAGWASFEARRLRSFREATKRTRQRPTAAPRNGAARNFAAGKIEFYSDWSRMVGQIPALAAFLTEHHFIAASQSSYRN
jgi:hypothetical protein